MQLELGEFQVLSADDVPAAVPAAEAGPAEVPAAGQHQPDPEPARGDGGLLPEQGDSEPGPADEGDSELREDALAAGAARPVRAVPAELRLSDQSERGSRAARRGAGFYQQGRVGVYLAGVPADKRPDILNIRRSRGGDSAEQTAGGRGDDGALGAGARRAEEQARARDRAEREGNTKAHGDAEVKQNTGSCYC